MAKPYSIDLRARVLEYLEKGNTKEDTSKLFSVGIATIYRWKRQKSQRGSLNPLKREYAYKKIDDKKLKEHMELNPDHFLFEIAREFSVTEQAIFYALKRLNITRKKKRIFTKKEMKKNEKPFRRN